MQGRVHATTAPIGGWNARDPQSLMDEKDAIKLDNWFPGANEVVSRKGYTPFISTGMGTGIVKTLAGITVGASSKLLACTGGNIYEIASGSASSALATGLTNDAWQHTVFGGRILLVNGSDAPRDYNGTAIAATSWSGSGLTIANLFGITAFKNRIFMLEKNTQNVWYGGLAAITGTLTKFDLSTVAGSFGGNVSAIGTLTLDGGDGVDDLLVIILSTGDTLVYQGSDPGVDFALVGVFKIGSPIGNRALFKVGPELVAITRDGVIPLGQVLRNGRTNDKATWTDKISTAMEDSIATFGTTDGWEGCFYPLGDKVIINLPKAGGHQQYVMNATTKAWCRYNGIDTQAWCLFNDKVYFGGKDGKVYLAETGASDNGAAINLDGQQAFSYMRNRASVKLFSGVRINFRASSNAQINLALNTDFKSKPRSASYRVGVENGTPWDTAAWDSFVWGGGEVIRGKWKVLGGKGYCASVRVSSSVNGQALAWQDTAYMYQPAGMI